VCIACMEGGRELRSSPTPVQHSAAVTHGAQPLSFLRALTLVALLMYMSSLSEKAVWGVLPPPAPPLSPLFHALARTLETDTSTRHSTRPRGGRVSWYQNWQGGTNWHALPCNTRVPVLHDRRGLHRKHDRGAGLHGAGRGRKGVGAGRGEASVRRGSRGHRAGTAGREARQCKRGAR